MKIWFKLAALFSRKRLERQMREEMQAHLDGLAERNVAAGMSADEARYAAQRAFGGVEQIKERARDARGMLWLEAIGRDLRFSFRSLRRSAAFSAAVIMTLALCIGANTTIMSVLYGLILKPTPFHDPEQIVEVYNTLPKAGIMKAMVGIPQYLDYRTQADQFAAVALFRGWMFNIGEEAEAQRLLGARVTADFFAVLGVQPLLGRFFTPEECTPGGVHVVVLTQSFWEQYFQADPAVVGRVIRLTGESYAIIGVMPRAAEAFNVDPLLLRPFEWSEAQAKQWRLAPAGLLYARIKPGVAHGAALAQLEILEKHFYESVGTPAERDALDHGGFRVGLNQFRAEQTKPVRSSLLLLQGGALLVLLLGCVNVANLMLARANARQAELAVRQALGAGRGALARQLLTEAALLAVAGGAVGLGLAWASLHLINTYTTVIIRQIHAVTFDGAILGLTLLVALTVAMVIGLLPVLRIWRSDLQARMQSGTRGASGGAGIRAVSGLLVTAQVALALMLLVGAGLLIRSFSKVMAINPGFDARQVIHGRIAFNAANRTPASAQAVQNLILEKMREIPGVESVSYSAVMPGDPGSTTITLPLGSAAPGKSVSDATASCQPVSAEFIATMGMRLLEGRSFTAADLLPNARKVIIVDRKFAERYLPGRSAVGAAFDFEGTHKPDTETTVVGVVETARLGGLEDQSGLPFVYSAMGTGWGAISLELRTMRPLADIAPLMRAKLRSVDPTLPLYEVCTLQMNLDDEMANRRGVMWLLGAFAGIALILSAVGIYGMLAYDVSQRTKEIGIRGAIGATRGQIVTLILRQGLWKTGIGVVLGLGGAFYLSHYLGSLLYEVGPTDPPIFAGVTGMLLLVALLASWLPARRAAKVDPMVALRTE